MDLQASPRWAENTRRKFGACTCSVPSTIISANCDEFAINEFATPQLCGSCKDQNRRLL